MARIFITGSSDGLGLLAAKALISSGHQVVLHARNEERAKDAMGKVPGAEKVLTGDLSGMEETSNLAQKVNDSGTFDAIIHNAGLYHVPGTARSRDGLPLLFAVNTLAPYILSALIRRPQRLIYLSSGMHRHGDASEARLDAILAGKNPPSYSDTKLHDLILALATARLWPDTSSNAVDPGWVPTKMGGSSAPDSLEEGYKTQVWLATGRDKEATLSGRYLRHKMQMKHHAQADEHDIQDKLLSVCGQLSGIPFPEPGI